MQRLGLEPVRLSVFYPVSYLFREKAKLYVRTRGQSRFGPGDLFSGVLDIIKEYGTIPAAVYGGTKEEIPANHAELYRELEQYMASVKTRAAWQEGPILQRVQALLTKYLGKPPTTFAYKGKTFFTTIFLQRSPDASLERVRYHYLIPVCAVLPVYGAACPGQLEAQQQLFQRATRGLLYVAQERGRPGVFCRSGCRH